MAKGKAIRLLMMRFRCRWASVIGWPSMIDQFMAGIMVLERAMAMARRMMVLATPQRPYFTNCTKTGVLWV